MSANETDVNWDEMDLGTDLGDGEVRGTVKDARYLLKVENIEKKTRGETKKDGTPDDKAGEEYLNIRMRIMDAQKEEFEGGIGEAVFDIFNLSEKAIWKLKNLIKAALPTYTGSKLPKELIGTFVTGFIFTQEYGGYENLRSKSFKTANGWQGLNFIIDENGKLENIGGSKKETKKTESKPAATPPKNGTKGTAKPASKPAADDEGEVEV